MNLAPAVKFVRQMDNELEAYPESIFFYCFDTSKRALTNAVFLLGSYVIHRLDLKLVKMLESLSWLDRAMLEPYRDATFADSDFDLTLEDCWGGLSKGIQSGCSTCCARAVRTTAGDSSTWTGLNVELHKVVPGKFLAFNGPVALGGQAKYQDDARRFRSLARSSTPTCSRTTGTDRVRGQLV